MRKLFFIIMTLAFMSTLFAQTPKQKRAPLTERQKLIIDIDRKIEDGVILEFLRKTNEIIKKSIKLNKPLASIEYSSFAVSLNIRIKYRWLIADTGLSRKWLKKIQELFVYMSKTQGYLTNAKLNGQTNTAKYKQAKEYLTVAHERFFELMKKTVRVSRSVRQKAQMEKDMWQRSMRKEHNIKKSEYSNF